jgi:hypothetical protein
MIFYLVNFVLVAVLGYIKIRHPEAIWKLVFYVTTASIGAVVDIVLFASAFPQIWKLEITAKTKMVLTGFITITLT